MKKKVMVLGAGIGQVPLIKISKRLGCEAIVVSHTRNYPGLKYADGYHLFDVKDKKAILSVAEIEKIDSIITQLDMGVETAAFVAEKLNIPGIGCEAARYFTDKYEMRKKAEALGFHVPRYYGVIDVEEACLAAREIGYPVIIKPVDNTASKGVILVTDESGLKTRFDESLRYSPRGKVIVEQFIEGQEYCVNSFSYDYKVHNLVVGIRENFRFADRFLPITTVFTSVNTAKSAAEKFVLDVHKRIVHGFGLNFGLTHGEYKYNKRTGKIYLIEIAARGGGMFIASDLIKLACGVNANQLLVRGSLGFKPASDSLTTKSGAAAYFTFLLAEGKVVRLNGVDKVAEIKGVHKAFLDDIYVGMEIEETKDKSSRKGPILVYGKTRRDCYKVIDQVKQVLEIEVKNQHGEIKGIDWGF